MRKRSSSVFSESATSFAELQQGPSALMLDTAMIALGLPVMLAFPVTFPNAAPPLFSLILLPCRNLLPFPKPTWTICAFTGR